ncbi:putative XRE-type DNA-binding protein [Enterobacter sp. BIGb0383]|uniref:helix-turn-helix domain-containing protein n=1 Tax=unclassified Enterobacter TaxID=2608935 RepID=UPI000F47F150|nr:MULTISPECIES: XRE family transcriptional regulator [unclassified Enterobacter]ROP60275.1 putative XRE-type DNA-binding protein [Enterobacter sp. BIGb0383]ROS08258.1 putative XRE-type DNA-binding protein [Enterobacter sp. BIGb0359]
MKSKMDNGIRHITPAGANIFSELGFDESQAQQLLAGAEKEVRQLLVLKQQLMQEISGWIADNNLRQADAALKLDISRPRVSDVVNLKTSKFTLDALVTMLVRLGKPVSLTVGQSISFRPDAQI